MLDIPPRVHGIIDYFIGLMFVILPTICKWDVLATPSLIFEISGSVIILYSLITDYEKGLVPILTIQKHLILDAVIGFFIIISPFLFGFYDESFTFHLIGGLTLMLLVGFSTTVSSSRSGSGPYFSPTDKRYY